MKCLIKKSTVIFIMMIVLIVGVMPTTPVNAASENVAKLTILSDGSGEAYGTHAFLYIQNISSEKIKVLGNTLSSKEGMTIGTFGNKTEGKGIYINLEAFYIENFDAYEERVSLTTSLTEDELDTVIDKMKDNNKWTYTSNCAWFSAKVWNSVAPSSKKLSAGIIKNPATLSKQIKKNSTFTSGKKLSNVDTDYVKRYKTSGSSISVSSETLRSGSTTSGSSSR